MAPNHDGSAADPTLPAAPAGIGEPISASHTRLGFDPVGTVIAGMIILVIAVIGGFAAGQAIGRALDVEPRWPTIVTIVVLAPVVTLIKWAVLGGVSADAITWVGTDGIAIASAKRTRVIAFRDVHRMNLDKAPTASRSYGNVAVHLRIDDRAGKKLYAVHGNVAAQVPSVSDWTTLADWERVEAALRAAPTASASHFIRATTDAWSAWQNRRG
jgi:hypothetical protein